MFIWLTDRHDRRCHCQALFPHSRHLLPILKMTYLLPLLLLQQLEQLRLLLQVPGSRASKSSVTCRLLLMLLLPSKAPCFLQALALQTTVLSEPQLTLQLLLGGRQKVPALLALPGRNLLALLLLLLLQQQLPASLPLQQSLLDRLTKAQHAAEGWSHLQSPEREMDSRVSESLNRFSSAASEAAAFVEGSKAPALRNRSPCSLLHISKPAQHIPVVKHKAIIPPSDQLHKQWRQHRSRQDPQDCRPHLIPARVRRPERGSRHACASNGPRQAGQRQAGSIHVPCGRPATWGMPAITHCL